MFSYVKILNNGQGIRGMETDAEMGRPFYHLTARRQIQQNLWTDKKENLIQKKL